VRLWSHERFTFPLPAGHRFPLSKYGLLRDRVVAEGLVHPSDVHEPGAATWGDLALAHAPALLSRIHDGTMSEREQRALGLPWSPELVERARRATQSTIEALADAAEHGLGMNLGGGTHHAGRDRVRGFCLVNDVAVAILAGRRDELCERAVVVDCDVHQGDGTAEILAGEPETFTLSVNGAQNFPHPRIPSDLDVELPRGTGDEAYLSALDRALGEALERGRPDLVAYLAGADPWEGDRLGRLALTKHGLRARDELVLDRARAAGAAVVVVLAGGYAPDPADTVDINAGTVAAVAART
jgi:acetoin utilization deacetylase AcuC-like enzyme